MTDLNKIEIPDLAIDGRMRDKVVDDDNYQSVIDSLLYNKRQLNILGDVKAQLLAPIKEGMDKVNKTYKTSEKPIEELVNDLTTALKGYLSDRHTRLLEEYSKLSDKKQTPAVLTKMKDIDDALAGGFRGDGGKISIRTLNQFTITDMAKVPHRYLTLDSGKVREDLKHMDRIPGIKQTSSNTIAVYLDKE